MSNDPRIHRHTFVNGRCEVCSLDAEDLRPHEHVFDVNWNCTICRLSYKTIYGNNHDPRLQMKTQPDIDAIAREAAEVIFPHSEWYSSKAEWRIDLDSSHRVIAAAIRRALEPLEQENKGLVKAMALKLKLERHLSEALSERDAAVNGILDLKRTNQMLAEQLLKHAEAIEVLKGVEWKGQIPHHDTCPFCEGWKKESHKPNCKLAKAIGK